MKLIKDLFSCSKNECFSSMRFIVIIGSLSIISCILFMTYTNDSRLADCIGGFGLILTALIGAKAVQSSCGEK